LVDKRERLLQIRVLVPPEAAATALEKSLLVLFFRKERLPSGRHPKVRPGATALAVL
jgi:hypothetical protein